MQRVKLESGSVRSIGYDVGKQLLEVEFDGGRVYHYFDVPHTVHAWLLRVPSKGAYINRMIKDEYRYEEVTESPVEPDLVAALQASLQRTDRTDPEA